MIKALTKIVLTCLLLLVYLVPALAADTIRSLDTLFPNLSKSQKESVFSETGMINTFFIRETPLIVPSAALGINLMDTVMEKKPNQFIEALLVIPHNERPLNLLDAYNAVGRVSDLSTHLGISSKGREVQIFEESTRLYNGERNRPIPDPPPATVLPYSDTMYLRIRDYFFGNTYFRGDFSISGNGITFNLANYATIWFLIFPLMGAEKFVVHIYMEPVIEGMLIYGIGGIDIPGFLVTRIDLASNIDRRIRIITNWLSSNLRSVN